MSSERTTPGDVTRLVQQQQEGDREAADRLLQLLYRELRSQAAAYFGSDRAGHTLQPTALVHEAFLRLVGNVEIQWEGRSHFFAVAAKAMRHVLADHAKARRAQKRGGDWNRVTLGRVGTDDETQVFDAADLHEALEELAKLSERQARIVELRFFGGLTVPEAARVLEVSERTVRGEWHLARAWLRHRLGKGQST
jgi:RNA polymerase sigma factor (TIGR02999 family)